VHPIPSIEQLRQRESMRALEVRYGRAAVVEALRGAAAEVRAHIASGGSAAGAADTILADTASRLSQTHVPSLRRVINATGVILHTNLGRAPLGQPAIDRLAALGSGYTNLEYDLERGQRSRRDAHAERLICRLTGAAAAVVVNNNAAATLLVLAAIASGREVIISRGELIEIGGGFRVPDVMAQSGAVLREVGTTNRTRAADYAAALSGRTALILRVHPSNFTIAGFTERPSLDAIVEIGRRFGVPIAEDLGSGYLTSSPLPALGGEPLVAGSIRAGADVVMFSGDKLLGGPQAGIIAGTEPLVARIRTHPLMRALRVDKLTYAALEATLEEHAAGRADRTIPVTRMLSMPIEEIAERAAALAATLTAHGLSAKVIDGYSTIGGGSAPGTTLPTRLVAISSPTSSAAAIEAQLRHNAPAILARIENDLVLLDLRTVDPADDALLADALRA
jgi:L-seryl-tRNA(Ser) seleniumtransferase